MFRFIKALIPVAVAHNQAYHVICTRVFFRNLADGLKPAAKNGQTAANPLLASSKGKGIGYSGNASSNILTDHITATGVFFAMDLVLYSK